MVLLAVLKDEMQIKIQFVKLCMLLLGDDVSSGERRMGLTTCENDIVV